MMQSGARWMLVGSLVSILMMGGLGLAMGKKVEKEEAIAQSEEKQIEVQQKQVETGQKEKEEDKLAVTKDVKSEIIELKLIWSKEFDQIVRDVVISGRQREIAAKQAEAFGVPAQTSFPIKVVVTEDKIRFLNDEGKPKKEVEILGVGSVVKITENGEYIGLRPMKREEKGLIVKGKFQLFNNDGEVLWESEEVEPTFELSEDGQTIVSQSVRESGELVNLIFLNSKGLKEAVKPLSKECAFYNLSFSEDGNYLGIAIGEDHAWLILYDKEGNKLWKKYLGGNIYNTELAISRRGNYIAVIMMSVDTGKRYLLMYNIAGIPLWKKEIDFVGSYTMSFSADERYLVLGSSGGKGRNKIYRGILWLYEVERGDVLWKYENESNNRAFFFTEFSPDNKFLLTGGVNTNPFALLFTLDGEKLWESEYSGKKYYDWEEKLNNGFLDSRKFRVVTKQGAYVYEILPEIKGGK